MVRLNRSPRNSSNVLLTGAVESLLSSNERGRAPVGWSLQLAQQVISPSRFRNVLRSISERYSRSAVRRSRVRPTGCHDGEVLFRVPCGCARFSPQSLGGGIRAIVGFGVPGALIQPGRRQLGVIGLWPSFGSEAARVVQRIQGRGCPNRSHLAVLRHPGEAGGHGGRI